MIVSCPSFIGVSIGSLLFLFDLGKVHFSLRILTLPRLHHSGAWDLPVSIPSFQKLRPSVTLALTPAVQPFESLSDHAKGEMLILDVPEINDDAMRLARQYGLEEVFGCARMYYGNSDKRKTLPWNNIYGITTFELG